MKETRDWQGTEFELLTITEAANLLRVSPETVRRMIRNGQLPTVRVGQRSRIPLQQLHRVFFAELTNKEGVN